jgi:hypothetical protein
MSLYNNANELLQDAIKQGIINVIQPPLLLGSVEMQLPNNVINVLNVKKWTDFLNHVITTSDNDEEIKFASHILEMCQEQYKQPEQVVTDQKAISTDDVITLVKDIDNCSTIDDILKLMKVSEIPITAPITKSTIDVKHVPLLPEIVRWRRPINANGKCRYYAYDISWYIERQTTCNESGGLVCFYSLFTPESREVARFDTLKSAKSNFLITIKHFQ